MTCITLSKQAKAGGKQADFVLCFFFDPEVRGDMFLTDYMTLYTRR
jgi:hypothetical protein